MPELALIDLDPAFAAGESNLETATCSRPASGATWGCGSCRAALEYSTLRTPPLTRLEAAAIVWFDAYVTSVDRTQRNVNMLLYERGCG